MYFLTCFIVQNLKNLLKQIHSYDDTLFWGAMSNWFPVSRYPRACEKTRRIKPFCSKISTSILFTSYRWKKRTLFMFQFWKLTKRYQRISFKQRVSVIIKWSISLRYLSFFSFSYWINSNKLYSGVQNLILPLCLKRLLQRVWNKMFGTLLECSSTLITSCSEFFLYKLFHSFLH